jgi:hypothetical protein
MTFLLCPHQSSYMSDSYNMDQLIDWRNKGLSAANSTGRCSRQSQSMPLVQKTLLCSTTVDTPTKYPDNSRTIHVPSTLVSCCLLILILKVCRHKQSWQKHTPIQRFTVLSATDCLATWHVTHYVTWPASYQLTTLSELSSYFLYCKCSWKEDHQLIGTMTVKSPLSAYESVMS